MLREGEVRIPSGCAIAAIIDRKGEPINGSEIIPVSYTHLDVYKRQVLPSPALFALMSPICICTRITTLGPSSPGESTRMRRPLD